ncbi:hypothetical protein YH63_000965 [Afipia massiliensis]|uniref:Cysteine rich repeat protein n=1 Tax=Afipia massiliensis TaxID=211460 RepID=A0A4U6BIY0_9BRAD|nr:hypothetical protein [Afipia massiliensis]TKT70106.1 hypothetical protein YH63_000965 [Afipia massiliensis]
MISTLKRVAALWTLAAMVIFAVATPAVSQQPTDEQRNAIRSACRADYEANCASVPPGGAASLQCLQKNMSKLSGSCKQAVNAIEPAAAAPKAETAPAPAAPAPAKAAAPAAAPKATAAPKAAAATPAQKPTDAQTAAIRSACRSDYQKNCASVPPGGEASLQCLQKSMPKLSPSCQKAVSAVGGGAAPAPGGAPAAAAAPAGAAAAPAPALVLRPMRPREELLVLRSACSGDVRALCGGVAPGGGRIVQCLAVRAADLSPACKDVLAQFAAR